MEENWRIWDKEKEYGDIFYMRSTGQRPEMESSKAAAKLVASIADKGDLILDVGCGAGHYLISLEAALQSPYSYLGVDATSHYIDLARKAFSQKDTRALRSKTDFMVGDIFNLPLEDKTADIVMCNNVLLHLPAVEKPLKELWRVTKKYLLVRALIGKTAFRIKQINSPESYSEDGEPANFHFFNIYSEDYIRTLVEGFQDVKDIKLTEDRDFNKQNLGHPSNYTSCTAPHDITTVVNGMQVNRYIIQPWQFLLIEKDRC